MLYVVPHDANPTGHAGGNMVHIPKDQVKQGLLDKLKQASHHATMMGVPNFEIVQVRVDIMGKESKQCIRENQPEHMKFNAFKKEPLQITSIRAFQKETYLCPIPHQAVVQQQTHTHSWNSGWLVIKLQALSREMMDDHDINCKVWDTHIAGIVLPTNNTHR